jgi:hypothetical protein
VHGCSPYYPWRLGPSGTNRLGGPKADLNSVVSEYSEHRTSISRAPYMHYKAKAAIIA